MSESSDESGFVLSESSDEKLRAEYSAEREKLVMDLEVAQYELELHAKTLVPFLQDLGMFNVSGQLQKFLREIESINEKREALYRATPPRLQGPPWEPRP